MNTYLQTCDYCNKEYLPTRRGVQRFCKNSCRSTSHKKKKEMRERLSAGLQNKNELVNIKKKKPVEIEKMRSAAVKNVVVGNLITEGGKAVLNLFTKEENKPATKGDIMKVIGHLERYQKMEDMPPNRHGQIPHFDMETKRVVYLGLINT